jgi:hypothetical protein
MLDALEREEFVGRTVQVQGKERSGAPRARLTTDRLGPRADQPVA